MCRKVQQSGLTEIVPSIHILTPSGRYPVFLHLESPQGALCGVAAVADRLTVGNILCQGLLSWH